MNIVDLISQWVSRSNDLKISEIYSDYGLTQYHYFTEIVRSWNHLHFIAKKTLRSLPKGSIKDSKQIEVYLYLTYRYFWEKAEFPDILLEIKTSQTEYNPKLLLSFYTKLSTFDWDIALQNKSKSDQLSIKYAIPSFTAYQSSGFGLGLLTYSSRSLTTLA